MDLRYSRQLTRFTLTPSEQGLLSKAAVVVVGAGGLGSPVLTYLACAGVGHITVIDGDVVELSNLNRQFLHGSVDIGRPKSESARRRILDLAPEAEVRLLGERLSSSAAADRNLVADVVVDATDNRESRELIGRWCVLNRTAVVWGAIFGMMGYASTFDGVLGRTYGDVFGDDAGAFTPASPADAGAFGAVCGVVGSIMGLEVVKLLIGHGEPLIDRLAYVDGWASDFRVLRFGGRVEHDGHAWTCRDTPTTP